MPQSAIDVVVELEVFRRLPYWTALATVGVPPHISVLFPWRRAPLSAQDIDDLRLATEAIQAFPIRFVGVDTFPNGTIFATIEPSESLISLMKRTWDAFTDTPPYSGEFEHPQPHLTLAKCPEEDMTTVLGEMEARLSPVLPLDVQVGSLTVLEQQPDDRWLTTATIALH